MAIFSAIVSYDVPIIFQKPGLGLGPLDSLPPYHQKPTKQSAIGPSERGSILTILLLLGAVWLISADTPFLAGRSRLLGTLTPPADFAPLAMTGGDPHVRALMRTISAAESHTAEPYHTLYGGQPVADLTNHPDRCVEIVTGPNIGDCTTAAGRYQFLTTTWYEKAQAYHPQPPRWYWWRSHYSFEPVYQDEVVYRWLTDASAWNADIPTLLRDGHIEEVLYLLSGTWTSLGYGIEDNSMTPHLRQIYFQMLEEELQ